MPDPSAPVPPILDSRKLRAFAMLARHGSFTLAARDLHLTQSAVSHAIKALESELSVQLVIRQGRAVKLTAPGAELLLHTHRILSEMKDALDHVEAYAVVSPREQNVPA